MAQSTTSHTALKRSAEPIGPVAAMTVSGVPKERQPDLVNQVRKATYEWASQIEQMQRYESDFASDLAQCTRPSDAVALCSKWMARRIDAAVSMQHRLIELWLDAVTAVAETELVLETGGGPEEDTSSGQ